MRIRQMLVIHEDLHNEWPGYFRAFFADSPDATTIVTMTGYASPGGSFKTIKAAVADASAKHPNTPIFRNGRQMAGPACFLDCHGHVYPIVTADELNLDCEDREYLGSFWARYQHASNAGELFRARPAGFRRAAADLACYASNKAAAMACRISGDISAALMYEGICDRIYGELPSYARGW